MPKKKILLLSCQGGYGHMAAADTLRKLLVDTYEFDTIYPIDALRILRAREKIFNFFLSHNFIAFTNFAVRYLTPYLFRRREEKTTRLIEAAIERSKADLVISVIPFVNYPATEAARRQNIPFLLITTDNDLSHWVLSLRKRALRDFKVTIGHDLPLTKGLLHQCQIADENICSIGLPLRPSFFNLQAKREELRLKRGFSPEKRVVLIIGGGIGASSLYQYTKILAKSSLDIHMIVCTGSNKKLFSKLMLIERDPTTTLEVIPFVENIHDFLALADLIITKSGPGTINEAFALQTPVIVDQTKTTLFWEKVNAKLVTYYDVGASISSFASLPSLVEDILFNEVTKQRIASNYAKVPPNRFADNIEPLLEEILQVTPVGNDALSVSCQRSLTI